MGQRKKKRTASLIERGERMMIKDMVQNAIEANRFRHLVTSGLIFKIRSEREMRKVLV